MKKPITEERPFCDFCEKPAYTQCLVCRKDLCSEHRLELMVYLDFQRASFMASLCPEHAKPLLPLLDSYQGMSATLERPGQNPEFNEARLKEILNFLRQPAGV